MIYFKIILMMNVILLIFKDEINIEAQHLMSFKGFHLWSRYEYKYYCNVEGLIFLILGS